MRAVQFLAAAAAPAFVLAGAASASAAAPSAEDPSTMTGSITFTPAEVKPGGEVDMRTEDCSPPGTAKSSAFTNASVPIKPAADGGVFAEGVVKSSTTPGSYSVMISCGDGTAEGSFTVINPHTPKGPVKAGGGWLAQAAERAERADASVIAGLALAGGGVIAVSALVTHRRRTRGRQD